MVRLIWQAVRYDIREGVLKKIPYFLVAVVFFSYLAVTAAMILSHQYGNCSVTDICVYLWQGSPKPVLRRVESFQIPLFYLVVHVLILFFACYYPARELKTRGRLLILQFKSRDIWWYGKCIWNFIGTFFIYLLFFTVIIIVNFVYEGDFGLSQEMQEQMQGILLEEKNSVILGYCFVLGFIVMLTMNQVQMVLQLLFPPGVGFVLMMSLLIASFCTETLMLPGNYLMLCRTLLFENGKAGMLSGCLYMAVIWIIFVFFGKVVMDNKDL